MLTPGFQFGILLRAHRSLWRTISRLHRYLVRLRWFGYQFSDAFRSQNLLLITLLIKPFRAPFGPSLHSLVTPLLVHQRMLVLRPLLTSARRSAILSNRSVLRTPRRSPGVSSTTFTAQSPDLQQCLLTVTDFAINCSLVQALQPRIRFLFVDSQFCYGLLSHIASRLCACLSLHFTTVRLWEDLHLQVLNMPSTQLKRLTI